jgi:hypothetical protein
MGFSLAIDIRWLREAELKHGRVAMLATMGWITCPGRDGDGMFHGIFQVEL